MSELRWVEAGQITSGEIVASINRAELDYGNVLHSVRLGRRNPDGKLTQFLRPADMTNLSDIAKSVSAWIHSDIDKIRKTA